MGREDKDNDENESVNSSAYEDSPRENLDHEKDEDGLADKVRSLNVKEHTQNEEGEDDNYYDDGDYNSSGSDGENQNKVRHTEEEDLLSDKERGLGSEDLDKKSKATDNKNEKESTSSSAPRDSPREALDQEKDEKRVASEMRSLDVSEDTKKKEGEQKGSYHNGDGSSGLDFENQNKLDQAAVGALDKDNQSDSDSENLNEGLATAKVERESDSESANPSKIYEAAADIRVAGEEFCSHSEILDKKSHETEKLESDSDLDSENPNKMCPVGDGVIGVNKNSGSDAETLDMKSQTTEKLEKESNADTEGPKKKGKTPRRVTFEEDRCLDCESPITVSRIVDEFICEEKDTDPGFDGAEVAETEATQANTWPVKAAALKIFGKMKEVVLISNVIRRLSVGKDNDEINFPWEKSVTEPAMKGTIILYTRLGCQDCKEIRSILRQKRLKVIEINVDIYPSRKLELEKNTGSSAVPRLYFNDFLVGGLSDLKVMNETSKLDEKINDLNEEASSAAPLPPLPGEDDVSCTSKVDELASAAKKLKESIVLGDRFYKMRRFSNCFLGSEAVDFFSRDQDLEREEAIEFGRKLANNHFFQHVLDENVFEDGNHLYRFLEHDPSISTCYNITSGLTEFKPKPIFEIASRLRFMTFAIFEAYVSEDGRHVDYQSIHDCEEFRRYLRITEELQRVELNGLSREEKLAFFINLYNMMVIHAILTWGYPSGALDKRKFFGEFKYVVGGCPYSLLTIQNGILRGNQRPPYSISKPFGPKDKQFKVSLPYPEPLIHFTLVCGTRSGPALRCYSPGNIDKELMEAARDFLMSAVVLDAETKVVSVNKILKWYSVDFGKSEPEVIKHAAVYLETSKSQEILDLLANNQLKVTYQPYDWGLNSY